MLNRLTLFRKTTTLINNSENKLLTFVGKIPQLCSNEEPNSKNGHLFIANKTTKTASKKFSDTFYVRLTEEKVIGLKEALNQDPKINKIAVVSPRFSLNNAFSDFISPLFKAIRGNNSLTELEFNWSIFRKNEQAQFLNEIAGNQALKDIEIYSDNPQTLSEELTHSLITVISRRNSNLTLKLTNITLQPSQFRPISSALGDAKSDDNAMIITIHAQNKTLSTSDWKYLEVKFPDNYDPNSYC